MLSHFYAGISPIDTREEKTSHPFIQGVYLSEDILPAAEFIEIDISGGTKSIFSPIAMMQSSAGIRLMRRRRLAREVKNKDLVAMVRDSLRNGNLPARKPRRSPKKK